MSVLQPVYTYTYTYTCIHRYMSLCVYVCLGDKYMYIYRVGCRIVVEESGLYEGGSDLVQVAEMHDPNTGTVQVWCVSHWPLPSSRYEACELPYTVLLLFVLPEKEL